MTLSIATIPGGDNRIHGSKENTMSQIIYIVGAIVIILALLSFVGLR